MLDFNWREYMGKAQQLVFSKNGVKTILDLTNPTITYQTIQTNSPRQLGEIVESATYLDDPNLDILDGQLLSGMDKPLFFNFIETLRRTHPDQFVDYGKFDDLVSETGECRKFGIDPENLSDKPQNIRLPKYHQGGLLYYIVTDVKSDVQKPIVQAEVHDEYEIDPDLSQDFYLTLQSKNCNFTIKQPSKPNQKYELHFWIYQKQDNSTCHFPDNVRGPQNNQIDLYISYNYVTHFTLTTVTGGEVWMYNYDNFWFAPVVSGLKSPRYKVTVVFEFIEQNKNDLNGEAYNTPCLHNFRIWDDYTNSLIKFPGPEYMPDGTGYGSQVGNQKIPTRSYAILSNKETSNQLYYTKNDFDAFEMNPHHIKCYYYSKNMCPAVYSYFNKWNYIYKFVGWQINGKAPEYVIDQIYAPFLSDITTNNNSLRTKCMSPFNCLKANETKQTLPTKTVGRSADAPTFSVYTYSSVFMTQKGSMSINGYYGNFIGKNVSDTADGTSVEYTFYTNHPISHFTVSEGLAGAYTNPYRSDSYTRKLRVSMYWDDELKKTHIYDRTSANELEFHLDNVDTIEDIQYTPEVELPSVRDADLNLLQNTIEYCKPYTIKVSGLVGGSTINQTKPVKFSYKANLLGEAEIDLDQITDFKETNVQLEFDYISDREHRSTYSSALDLYTPNQITLDYETLSETGNIKVNAHGGVKNSKIYWIYPENPNFDVDGKTVVVQKDETFDADGNGSIILDPTLLKSLETVSVKVQFAKQLPEVIVKSPEEPQS